VKKERPIDASRLATQRDDGAKLGEFYFGQPPYQVSVSNDEHGIGVLDDVFEQPLAIAHQQQAESWGLGSRLWRESRQAG
jgi:hypothetical protein